MHRVLFQRHWELCSRPTLRADFIDLAVFRTLYEALRRLYILLMDVGMRPMFMPHYFLHLPR